MSGFRDRFVVALGGAEHPPAAPAPAEPQLPPGHPPPARYFQTVSPPPPPSPLVFLLPLSVTLPSRKTSAVRDKPTPAATPIFFFSLSLSFYFFFPSPLKVHLSKLGAPRQRRLDLEKNEEGGDFAG